MCWGPPSSGGIWKRLCRRKQIWKSRPTKFQREMVKLASRWNILFLSPCWHTNAPKGPKKPKKPTQEPPQKWFSFRKREERVMENTFCALAVTYSVAIFYFLYDNIWNMRLENNQRWYLSWETLFALWLSLSLWPQQEQILQITVLKPSRVGEALFSLAEMVRPGFPYLPNIFGWSSR